MKRTRTGGTPARAFMAQGFHHFETAPPSREAMARIERILGELPVGISPDLHNDLKRIRDAEAPMPEGWRLNRIAQLVAFHVAPKAEEPWRERVHAIARGEEIHA